MATLTNFGKAIRKLRIEYGETMMDMAEKLSKAPSYLSAIETGSRTPPASIVDEVVRIYGLPVDAAQKLHKAAVESATAFKIKPATENDRELVAAFARKLDTLTTNQRESILQVLNNK
ncbi:MAG: helix-turn-helix transcriptional regulator [Burkholderiaceae bacterium]|nr:helix-turn-helix transcriptional regulator [Burkholderiaceae bacterium]